MDKALPSEHPPARSWRRPLIGSLALVACILLAVYLFVPEFLRATTNDAYVEAHIEAISARVPGYVEALHINDNSHVKRGEVLLELDPRDYEVKVATAEANLAASRSGLGEARARLAVADQRVVVAEADAKAVAARVRLAADDLSRFVGVSDVRAVSTQQLDTATAEVASTRAALSAAEASVGLARADAQLASANEETMRDAIRQAEAVLRRARLNLSYTHIIAPENGSIAEKLAERGNYVVPGQRLMSLVPTAVYVVANFEETQLHGIGIGSAAYVKVDALPGVHLRGHVDSIQRGTGSEFALLPPENATGNFVKIAQRIPVKIILDESPAILSRLAPGMSAVVSVRYSKGASWLPVFD
ncbi:MAG: HlyD family secretion protein [Steroidobacteraceae bacterium]